MASRSEVTRVLAELNSGDAQAAETLLPLVYDELRRLAASYLGERQRSFTLQPTALVHEAYIRLVETREENWHSRVHFFSVAARAMRHVLVDYARARRAAKRGRGLRGASLENAQEPADRQGAYVLELDEALSRLADIDPRQARVVELRFFAGMTVEETAEALGVSPRTVKREWNTAKAWLHREISRGG